MPTSRRSPSRIARTASGPTSPPPERSPTTSIRSSSRGTISPSSRGRRTRPASSTSDRVAAPWRRTFGRWRRSSASSRRTSGSGNRSPTRRCRPTSTTSTRRPRSPRSVPRMTRYRDLGLTVGQLSPGPLNGITDVPGVRVGVSTLIEGDGRLVRGQGPIRTGVTVIVPTERIGRHVVFAGCHRLNGNGEVTGLEWVRESGVLSTPIAITNTHSVGVVRDALVAHDVATHEEHDSFWSLPVVGETYDGGLNDINGFHVRPEHVDAALDAASGGPVPEGNAGGGTGMICHEFKGGTGSASRVVGGYVLGALVQ